MYKLIEIEPVELNNFDKFIEKSPTFQRYKSRMGLESSHFMAPDNKVFSATVFNQMGKLDVFVHDMETGVTGMSGTCKIPRNETEQICDMWANIIAKKIVDESKTLYMETYKK